MPCTKPRYSSSIKTLKLKPNWLQVSFNSCIISHNGSTIANDLLMILLLPACPRVDICLIEHRVHRSRNPILHVNIVKMLCCKKNHGMQEGQSSVKASVHIPFHACTPCTHKQPSDKDGGIQFY